MAKVDELLVEIKGDISDLEGKLEKAVKETKDASDSMGGAFSALNNPIGKVGVAFGAFGLAVEGAQKAIAPFISAMEQMNKASGILATANRVGVAAEKFQELSFAARAVGADSEDVFDVMKDLSVRITDAANGATAYEEVLNKVGLESKKLVGLPVEEQFRKFADAIAGASSELQLFAVDELVSDPGVRMIEVLRQGSKGLDEMAKEARDLNVVISEMELETMTEATMEVQKMKAGFEALMNEVLIAIAPMMKEFLAATTAGLKELNKWLGLSDDNSKKLLDAQKELAAINARIEKGGRNVNVLEQKRGEILDRILGLQVAISKETQKQFEIEEKRAASSSAKGGGADLFDGLMTGAAGTEAGFSTIGEKRQTEVEKPEEEAFGGLMTGTPWILTEEGQTQADAMREEELQKQREFNQALMDIEQSTQEYNRRLWESGWKGKADIMSKTMGSMSKLMNSESRKMFEVGKAAAMAQVLIDTPKAAMSAYSAMAGIPVVGPALGAAAAAAAVASGMAQLQNIKSTSFGGGGGGGAGGISSGGGAVGGASAEPQEVVQRTDVAVTLVGDNFGGDGVVNLIDRLNEAVGDGATLRATQLG